MVSRIEVTMGTSQSAKGPSSNVSMVPPWADDQPDQPLPPPPTGRFKNFRRAMSKYVKSGNHDTLKTALGHYARTSTGGAKVAVRRFGNIIKTGGALLNFLATGQAPANAPGLSFSQIAGKPVEEAISIVADNLIAINGDSDRIRTAMNNALIEALEGVDTFNPSNMTEDMLADVMVNYLTESIFLDVLQNSGESFNYLDNPIELVSRQNDLHELTRTIVDKNLSGKTKDGIHALNAARISDLQRQAIIEVWQEWENYQ
jgi:hypothetical protein